MGKNTNGVRPILIKQQEENTIYNVIINNMRKDMNMILCIAIAPCRV